MKINPVLRKELAVNARSSKVLVQILVYNIVLAAISLMVYFIEFNISGVGDYSGILVVYTSILIIETGLVCFTVPAITAASIAGEREKQTLDILFTTPLKSSKIIFGKLYASLFTVLFLLLSSLPILNIVLSIGGIKASSVVQFLVFIFVLAVLFGSIGLLFSSIMKRSVPATVLTYGVMMLFIVGPFIIMVLVTTVATMLGQGAATGAIGTDSYAGGIVGILLIDPAFSFWTMIESQKGNYTYVYEFLTKSGGCPAIIANHWFTLSMFVQLLVSFGILFWASKVLNPIGRKKKVIPVAIVSGDRTQTVSSNDAAVLKEESTLEDSRTLYKDNKHVQERQGEKKEIETPEIDGKKEKGKGGR